MYVEKIEGADYYRYIFEIIEYDVRQAAIYNMKWYVASLNRHLDNSRYLFFLGHNRCDLMLRINESEVRDGEFCQKMLKNAQEWVRKTSENFKMLSEGSVPPVICTDSYYEFEKMRQEWYVEGDTALSAALHP